MPDNNLLARQQRLFAPAPFNFQIRILEPSNAEIRAQIENIDQAFDKLYKALQQHYYVETQKEVSSQGQSDIDELDALTPDEKAAYQAWVALIPAVPASYHALVSVLKKKQNKLYLAKHRQTLLNDIHCEATLMKVLCLPYYNNPSIIEEFKKEWTTELNTAVQEQNASLINCFTQLLEQLKGATDKTSELSLKTKYRQCLVNFLYRNINLNLNSLAKTDTMLNLPPHTDLITTKTFTDLYIAELGIPMIPKLSTYFELIANLKNGSTNQQTLDEIKNDAKTKREEAHVNQDEEGRKYYNNLIFATQNLMNAYGSYQLIHYTEEDKQADIKMVIEHIHTYLIPNYKNYETTLQQQAHYTELLTEQINTMLTQEVEPAYRQVQEDIEAALILQNVQNQARTTILTPSAA